MTEAHRSTGSEDRDFIDAMTGQHYGKYVLAALGLRRVQRFSKDGSAEHLDVLMPEDPEACSMTFRVLSQGGRFDRGPVSAEEARNIFEAVVDDGTEDWQRAHNSLSAIEETR